MIDCRDIMLSIDYEEDEGILIIESSDGWDDTIRR